MTDQEAAQTRYVRVYGFEDPILIRADQYDPAVHIELEDHQREMQARLELEDTWRKRLGIEPNRRRAKAKSEAV
jgi:hypothetical protein